MTQDINFAPQDLDEQALAYFPSGRPAARIGLTMSFYFREPGSIEIRKALVHCIEQYLHQAEGLLRIYAVAKEKRHRKLKPGQSPDPVLLHAMITNDSYLEFEASGAERQGISHSWSIAAFAEDLTRISHTRS